MSNSTSTKSDSGLRAGVMGSSELFAQAIANIAPSAVIAFTAAAIYLTAGKATWVSFAVATVIILAVGYNISQFAKRRASAGSLYSYAAKGLGPFGAYFTGITLILGCFGIASASLSGSTVYMTTVLNNLGLPVSGALSQVVIAIVLGSAATFFTIRGIRLSARVSLVLELISITIISIVLVLALITLGDKAFDPSQFNFEGIPFSGVATGMVLAILGFVGFSSADALGREARDAYRAIPRAIMWSAVGVGLLYVFAAYTQVAVLGDKLGGAASPMDDIAAFVGMPAWFIPILNFGIAASFFAVVVAPINVIGRIVYVMGKEGVIHESLGRTHESHLTPHRAILWIAPFIILLPAALYLMGFDGISVLVWINTTGTYGYMFAYAAVSLAAVRYLKTLNAATPLVWVSAIVSVLGMAYVFYANVFPIPAFPFNVLPWIFLALVAIALVWYANLKSKHPEVIARIGTTETDVLEGIG